ncbi:MAG: hypothetical protein ABEJ08_06035 [Halobacteriaceae archaeon]
MNEVVYDRLEVLGIAVGAFLALAGLGTLVGMPWQYANSTVVTVGQALGAALTVLLGAGLIWLVRLDR